MSGSLDFKKIGMFKKQVRGTYLLPAKSPFGNGIAKSLDKSASKFKIQYFLASLHAARAARGFRHCCIIYCDVIIYKSTKKGVENKRP